MTVFFDSRGVRAFAPLLCSALMACESTTEIRVRSPGLVGARARDATGAMIELPGDGKPGETSGTLGPPSGYVFGGHEQRLTFVRDASGELRYEAPDTVGAEQGTLVAADGAIVVPPSYMGADNAARYGSDAGMRFLVWYEEMHRGRPRRIPSFEIWASTPLSNVEKAQVHTVPIRAVGAVLASIGGALAIGSAASFLAGKDDGRILGAFLGGFALAFGAGGVAVLTVPETTTPIDFAER